MPVSQLGRRLKGRTGAMGASRTSSYVTQTSLHRPHLPIARELAPTPISGPTLRLTSRAQYDLDVVNLGLGNRLECLRSSSNSILQFFLRIATG